MVKKHGLMLPAEMEANIREDYRRRVSQLLGLAEAVRSEIERQWSSGTPIAMYSLEPHDLPQLGIKALMDVLDQWFQSDFSVRSSYQTYDLTCTPHTEMRFQR